MSTTPSLPRRRMLGACALAFAASTLVEVPASAGWSFGKSEQVKGNGKIMRQTREVRQFDGLALALPGTVEIRTGGSEGLSIETDDNLLPLIETVVENGTLKIRSKEKTNIQTRNLKIVVQARNVERLTLGGSGSIDADRVSGSRVVFDIGGSGTITVGKADSDNIGVNLAGSGDLKVKDGSTRNLSATIGGSGNVDLARLRADKASVTVAGSGDATLWVRDSLNVTIAGSGTISYYGDPKTSTSSVGSGEIRRLGPAPR